MKNKITRHRIITFVAPSIVVKAFKSSKRSPHCPALNDKCFVVSEIFGASVEPGHRLEADGEGRPRHRFMCDDGSKPICDSGDDEGIIA